MLISLWLLTLLFASIGTWRCLKKKTPPASRPAVASKPGITVLKPLCGMDSGLRQNLESFFRLSYPSYELIFSVAHSNDPAIKVVEHLQREYPHIHSWLVIGDVKAGPNPKVNNLIRSYELATHDLILISDSNVRVPVHYLTRLSEELAPGVGVVTSIVAGVAPHDFGGKLEAAYLNTFYARGMELAFATGNPCVVGKSMLFRKSVAASFGGIRALGCYLAEDYALGEEMRKLGLRVALTKEAIPQFLGDYSLGAFWKRHLRWGRIRKAHAPVAFVLEPLFSPLLSSLVAGFAFADGPGFWSFSMTFFLLNLSFWLACDLALMSRYSGKSELTAPFVWLARELLAFPLWLSVASGNTVNWRGRILTLRMGGMIVSGIEQETECVSSFGERRPLPTRWRATTRPATGGAGNQTAI